MNKYTLIIILLLSIISCNSKKKINKNETKEKTDLIKNVFFSNQVEINTDSLPSLEIDSLYFYNVKNFGAKGDGVHNDTKAIQQCLNFIKKKGRGTVYFPNGTYLISRANVPGQGYSLLGVDNLNIIGESKKSSIIKLASKQKNFTTIIEFHNNKNIFINNISFNGNFHNNNPAKPDEHLAGIFIDNSKKIHISNCNFINTGGDGITIRGVNKPSYMILIENCFFDFNQRNGITLGSGFDKIEIKNCYFGKKIDDSPIDTEPTSGTCKNIYIHDNIFYTPTEISLGGGKNTIGKNITMKNNLLYNCRVYIYRAKNLSLINNKLIFNNKKSAIICLGYNDSITIYNNKITKDEGPSFYIVKTKYSVDSPRNIRVVSNDIFIKKGKAFIVDGGNKINIEHNSIISSKGSVGVYCFSGFPIEEINVKYNNFRGFKVGIVLYTYNNNLIENVSIANNNFLNSNEQRCTSIINYKYYNKKDSSFFKNIRLYNNKQL